MSIAGEIFIGVYAAGFLLGVTYIGLSCVTQIYLRCINQLPNPKPPEQNLQV